MPATLTKNPQFCNNEPSARCTGPRCRWVLWRGPGRRDGDPSGIRNPESGVRLFLMGGRGVVSANLISKQFSKRFVKIQLRLLLIGGGGHPWSVINNLLENGLRGVPHPYEQQAGWILTNLFENYLLKIFAKQLLDPPSGTGGLGFLRFFCTFWLIEIQLRLLL